MSSQTNQIDLSKIDLNQVGQTVDQKADQKTDKKEEVYYMVDEEKIESIVSLFVNWCQLKKIKSEDIKQLYEDLSNQWEKSEYTSFGLNANQGHLMEFLKFYITLTWDEKKLFDQIDDV